MHRQIDRQTERQTDKDRERGARDLEIGRQTETDIEEESANKFFL